MSCAALNGCPLLVKRRDSNLNDSGTHSGHGHIGVLVSTAITRRVLCKQDHAVRCFKDFRRAAFVDENRRAGLKRDTGKEQSSRFAGSYFPPIGNPSYPPP